MKVHKFLKRGTSHSNFCEDFLFFQEMPDNYFVAAVFDGCSGGKESHFASTLYAKVFKNICKNGVFITEKLTLQELMADILFQSIMQIDELRQKLNLAYDELLSTVVLLVGNSKTRKARAISIGDGLIVIDGKKHRIDQNNQPDYLAYHLIELRNKFNFMQWLDENQYQFDIEEFSDISISTDGIFTFIREKLKSTDDELEFDYINYLTKDNYLIENSAMLARKCNILKNKHQLQNYDDLAILRVVNEA